VSRHRGAGQNKNTGDLRGEIDANDNASLCADERKGIGARTGRNRGKNRKEQERKQAAEQWKQVKIQGRDDVWL
jgi:hypothetical protein